MNWSETDVVVFLKKGFSGCLGHYLFNSICRTGKISVRWCFWWMRTHQHILSHDRFGTEYLGAPSLVAFLDNCQNDCWWRQNKNIAFHSSDNPRSLFNAVFKTHFPRRYSSFCWFYAKWKNETNNTSSPTKSTCSATALGSGKCPCPAIEKSVARVKFYKHFSFTTPDVVFYPKDAECGIVLSVVGFGGHWIIHGGAIDAGRGPPEKYARQLDYRWEAFSLAAKTYQYSSKRWQ